MLRDIFGSLYDIVDRGSCHVEHCNNPSVISFANNSESITAFELCYHHLLQMYNDLGDVINSKREDQLKYKKERNGL